MTALSKKEDWELMYEGREMTSGAPVSDKKIVSGRLLLKRRLALGVKRIIGPKVLRLMSNYENYHLWEGIFNQHLVGIEPGAKVLEVGSAPGDFLVNFKQAYDCVPYGVDYSETGVELNRRVFTSHNINPENVIFADFFSDEFHEQYKGSFDVVISQGFIEHFTDAGVVVERHLDLLAKDGYLIITVPNFRGVNGMLLRLFNRRVLPIHNFDVMQKDNFRSLFGSNRLSPLFCSYYGVFSFYLFAARKNSRGQFLLDICNKAQPLLNLVFRLAFKDRGFESRLFNPSLVFIGRKIQ
jgi:SAM-dependent methyltransferase